MYESDFTVFINSSGEDPVTGLCHYSAIAGEEAPLEPFDPPMQVPGAAVLVYMSESRIGFNISERKLLNPTIYRQLAHNPRRHPEASETPQKSVLSFSTSTVWVQRTHTGYYEITCNRHKWRVCDTIASRLHQNDRAWLRNGHGDAW